MDWDKSKETGGEYDNLGAIAQSIRAAASQQQGDSLALLRLLRLLESLHQEIRDGLFQAALPDNRQALYSLLRDIELSGGWPYIYRMKLQAFLQKLQDSGDLEWRTPGTASGEKHEPKPAPEESLG